VFDLKLGILLRIEMVITMLTQQSCDFFLSIFYTFHKPAGRKQTVSWFLSRSLGFEKIRYLAAENHYVRAFTKNSQKGHSLKAQH